MPVVAYPGSHSNPIPSVDQRPRIIIFAESGLLAGDLAAWLSGRFAVDRVTSTPGANNSVDRGARALILLNSESQPLARPVLDLVENCLAVGCAVIMLGVDPDTCPVAWDRRVCLLPALPEPVEVFSALDRLVLRAAQGGA